MGSHEIEVSILTKFSKIRKHHSGTNTPQVPSPLRPASHGVGSTATGPGDRDISGKFRAASILAANIFAPACGDFGYPHRGPGGTMTATPKPGRPAQCLALFLRIEMKEAKNRRGFSSGVASLSCPNPLELHPS